MIILIPKRTSQVHVANKMIKKKAKTHKQTDNIDDNTSNKDNESSSSDRENMYFHIPKENTKGVKSHVRPTLSSRFSCYMEMVNSTGVCLLVSTTLRNRNRGIKLPKTLIMKSPKHLPSSLCVILYHSSLVIVLHTSLGLKNNCST